MKIQEYQAKNLLKEFGILVPLATIVRTPSSAEIMAANIGMPVIIKAQIIAGGRGKAGGIKTATSPAEAREIAASLLGKRLVTPQTLPEGLLVKKLLIEKKIEHQKEFYLAIAVDRARELPVIIASPSGGTGIEEIAQKFPEKIHEEIIDPLAGPQAFQKRRLALALEFPPEAVASFMDIISRLYQLFEKKDCVLVEINPLVITSDNRLFVLDAKIILDDNAGFRHPEFKDLVDPADEDSLEAKARKYGINYVKLSGNIGLITNGAGLGMATLDRIYSLGGKSAGFIDLGGGAKLEEIEAALRILLEDPDIKTILINVYAGIIRSGFLVSAITRALESRRVPLVIRLAGDDSEAAIKLCKEAGLKFFEAKDPEEAVKRAIELAVAVGGN